MAGTCRCPECSHWVSKVVQSHEQRDGRMVRKRQCRRCQHQWFTVQTAEVVIERERVVYKNKRPMLKRLLSAD